LGIENHNDQGIQGVGINGKLLAYEHELIQQSHVEDMEKKRKGIALKTSSSKENHKEDSSDDQDAENLNLIVKKFGKFLKRSTDKKFSKPSKKLKTNNNTFTCFECGKQGQSSLIVLSTLKSILLK